MLPPPPPDSEPRCTDPLGPHSMRPLADTSGVGRSAARPEYHPTGLLLHSGVRSRRRCERCCLFVVEFISRCSMFSPRRGKQAFTTASPAGNFPYYIRAPAPRAPHSRNHDSERLIPRPPHWQARESQVASQGRQIAAFNFPAYVLRVRKRLPTHCIIQR